MSRTQYLIEKVMAGLCLSEDPNDQALCASLAMLLRSWDAGLCERLLTKIKIVANREERVDRLRPSRN